MSGRRILIVDDSTFTGEAVAWALRKAGFEPIVARDLWDLERPDIGTPDLVLMDVVLQEAFGDDLAPLLRGSRGIECPIYLLSSLPDAELAQRAEDAGLDGYISKRGGLTAILVRVAELLGGEAPAMSPEQALAERLALASRQSVRRIVHIAASTDHWNAPAIVAEAHALIGDAALLGAEGLAAAAQKVRDTTRAAGSEGPTPEIVQAIRELGELANAGAASLAGKLLVVDASGFCRDTLYPALDRAGYVMVEAQTLAEARQKVHAARYDLILVDERLQREDPSVVPELRGAVPEVRLEIVGVMPLAKHLTPTRLVDEIRGFTRRST